MTLLVVLGVVVIGYLVFFRQRQQPPAVRTVITRTKATSRSWRKKIRTLWTRRKPDQRLKDWAATIDRTQQKDRFKDIQAWLAGLPAAEGAALNQAIEAFCAERQIDPAWLLDGKINSDPALKQEIEEAISQYVASYWRARQIEPKIQAFDAFQRWQAAPEARQNLAFGDQLHKALLARGLVTISQDLYLAPEAQRRAEAIRAIRAAAEQQRDAFYAVLYSLPTAAAAEPAASPATASTQKQPATPATSSS
jgi:hypothetical protein